MLLRGLRSQRLRQRGSQLVGLKSKRPGPALVRNPALRIDQINTVGPTGIGLLGRIAEFVEDGWKLDAKFSHAGPGDEGSIIFSFRAGEDNVVFDIALHLPNVAGMGLGNVDHQKSDSIVILPVEFIEGGNLPPERRSSVAAEHKHHGLPLVEHGELNPVGLVDLEQREIWCVISDV